MRRKIYGRLLASATGNRGETKAWKVSHSVFWLDESRVVNTCFAASEPTVGLEMKVSDSQRKLYMADTGLLVSHALPKLQLRQRNSIGN